MDELTAERYAPLANKWGQDRPEPPRRSPPVNRWGDTIEQQIARRAALAEAMGDDE